MNFKQIPIFLISYNRLSYIKRIVSYLEKKGYTNIHIIDNRSSYPPLLQYFETSPHTIHYMDKNYGHNVLFEAPEFKEIIDNEYFVLSDPDVLPIEECPDDFVEFFYKILQTYKKVSKVGFSLKIDDLPDTYNLKDTVIKWEQNFYKKPIKGSNPKLYKALIDTTFALYRPLKYVKTQKNNIRVGYPYEARHLPWYQDSSKLDEETIYYNKSDLGSGNWNGTKTSEFFNVTEVNWVKFLRIPLIKIKKKGNKVRYLLFGTLPIYKKKLSGN